jgi:hypothetical protein
MHPLVLLWLGRSAKLGGFVAPSGLLEPGYFAVGDVVASCNFNRRLALAAPLVGPKAHRTQKKELLLQVDDLKFRSKKSPDLI